jgi:hypothetical protein
MMRFPRYIISGGGSSLPLAEIASIIVIDF